MDSLRTVAVGLVLIEHFAYFVGRHISAGFYGVDLFFVISGFLITNILLKSTGDFGKTYKSFIGRRTLRIFPIYYLTVFLLFFIGNEPVNRYFIYCLTYTYNYAWIYFSIPINCISHFWSLCVEEQFYLFWPLLVLGLRKRLFLLKIVISGIIAICSLQFIFLLIKPVVPYNGVGLFPQANALCIGAMGSVFYRERRVPMSLLNNKLLEVVMFALLVFFLVTDFRLKYLVCPLISLFFILKTTTETGFSFNTVNRFLNKETVVYLGTISYGIYLYHLPLEFYLTEGVFNKFFWDKIDFSSLGTLSRLRWHSWIIKLPLYSVITVFVAHYSHKYLEVPLLALKDRWFRY